MSPQQRLVVIEWLGSGCSMAGALLIAFPTNDPRFIGYLFFAVANISLLTWAVQQRYWGISAMNAFFALTTIIGLFNHYPR